MVSFLRNFQIHSPSFWFGFVAGILFWWIVYTLRHYLPRFIAFFRERMQAAREELSLGIENRLRNDMLQLAQRQHIAAPLFSLDEIAIQPRIIAPPPLVVPGAVPPTDDPVRLTIPYLPEWPELAAVYNTPSLTLVEALQGGANLILIGHPGSGKSFALAYLTSLLSRRDPQAGELVNHVPLLLHAANISEISEEKTSIDLVIEALSGSVSTLTQQRLSEFLHAIFASRRVLILLDGLDELPSDDMKQAVNFLDMLLKEFPSIRVVVTSSVDTFAGLPSLDMHPVALAAWSQPEKVKFIDNWRQMWTRFAAVEIPTPTNDEAVSEPVNPLLIRNWLLTREEPLLPLEITLQVWAAYAGDMLGTDIPSAIEAHLRRMSSTIPDARPAMEQLAIQMVMSSSFSVTKKDAANWVAEFEQPDLINGEDVFVEEEQPTTEVKQDQQKIKIERIIPDLTTNGLLISRHHNWIAFLHPVMTGYLAASALAKFGTTHSIQD